MRSAGLLILAGALGLVLAACGSSGPGVSHGEDLSKGRELFLSGDGDTGEPSCGSCHTLAAAGSKGVAGPNLDDAFRGSREDGFEESTFEQVVREQIAYPGSGWACPPTSSAARMRTTSRTSWHVVRRTRRIRPVRLQTIRSSRPRGPRSSPKQGACRATRSLQPGRAEQSVRISTRHEPPKELVIDRVTNGSGTMPSFKDRMSEQQIEAVADFVSQSAGG